MEYLRIERALNRVVGDSITEGRFYQTAGEFENILNDTRTTPREKAVQIAEVIERGIINSAQENS